MKPPRRLVYVTKLAIHRRLVDLLHPEDSLILYGCGGLPSTGVCRHVAATARHFEVPVFFLGDLDPGDLTALLALRHGNPGLRAARAELPVRYLGIGDDWLGLFPRRLRTGALIDLSPAEADHLRLIRQLAGGVDDVGAESTRLLDRGKKVELEGLLRWAQPGTALGRKVRASLLAARPER